MSDRMASYEAAEKLDEAEKIIADVIRRNYVQMGQLGEQLMAIYTFLESVKKPYVDAIRYHENQTMLRSLDTRATQKAVDCVVAQ